MQDPSLADYDHGWLGTVAMLRGLGVDLSFDGGASLLPTTDGKKCEKTVIEIVADASAGRGLAMCQGFGRIRHIATPTLWLQRNMVANITITKQAGKDNLALLDTWKLMYKCGFNFSNGPSDFALNTELQALDIKHHELDGNDVDCIEEIHDAEQQHRSIEKP